jgi:hypothetical protein
LDTGVRAGRDFFELFILWDRVAEKDVEGLQGWVKKIETCVNRIAL